MTNREFLTAVSQNAITPEIIAFAGESLDKLDARNAARNAKPSKTQIANEPLKIAILGYLADHANAVASDIAKGVSTDDAPVSTNKASALCRLLVGEGKVVQTEIKVKGKGALKAYSLADGE